MRKAAIVFGIFLVLVLAGLILAPHFVDLDRFRGPIAAQLAKRTRLPVELAGPIRLVLLPTPALTARDVRVANPPGAAVPSMVRLRALEVKAALLPLLAGRVELRSAVLVDPEFDVEKLPDGSLNWRFAAAPAEGSAGAPTAAPARITIPALDSITVQNGAVTWRRADGIERFEHINATGALEPASGGISATGTLVARGAAVSFDFRSGAPGAAEVPLQATVTTRPTARLQVDAMLTGKAGARRIAGKIKLSGEDARALLATLAHASVPAVLAQPIGINADLAGSAQSLSLDHLAVDLGPLHAEGRLSATAGPPPDLKLTLAVSQLDLDRWPVARQAALAPAPIAGAFAATEAVPIVPAGGAGIQSLPTSFDASLDIGVDAMLWRGGLIRNARLKLLLAEGRLTLERLAAELPGGSDASLSGSATLAPSGRHAEGILRVNADDLRSLASWFGVSFDRIPADRLRKASLTSHLMLNDDRLDINDIDATLDATRIGGAATVLLRARPGIGLRFAADRLNLDAYLPLPGTRAPPAAPAAPPSDAATAREAAPAAAAPVSIMRLLAGIDANLDGRLKGLTWRGQPMSDVHLSGTLLEGETTIHALTIGDVGGATANLSGVVEELAGAPTGQLAFDMHGPELERVLRLISPRLASGRNYGAFSLGGGMQYDKDTVTIDSDLQLLDGHLHVVGDVARPGGALDFGYELDHPSLERLVQAFAPQYQPTSDPGAVKLTGRLAGERHRFTLQHVALAIGQSTVEGTIGVDLTGKRPHLDADLTAGDWAIDRLLSQRQTAMLDRIPGGAALAPAIRLAAVQPPPAAEASSWSDAPLDLGVLRRADVGLKLAAHALSYGSWHIDAPVVSAALSDGVLTLSQLTGTMLGGNLSASGAVDATAVPKLQAKLALKNGDFKSALGNGLLDGRFDLEANLAAAGASEAEMVAHAAGALTLESGEGSLGGFNFDAVNAALTAHPGDLAAILRSGAGGRTSFSRLEGSFRLADGIATSDDLRLVAAGGEGRATAQFDLPKWATTSRIAWKLAAIPDAPPLVMRLDGPIDAPDTVFEVNALEQYLAHRAPAAKVRP